MPESESEGDGDPRSIPTIRPNPRPPWTSTTYILDGERRTDEAGILLNVQEAEKMTLEIVKYDRGTNHDRLGSRTKGATHHRYVCKVVIHLSQEQVQSETEDGEQLSRTSVRQFVLKLTDASIGCSGEAIENVNEADADRDEHAECRNKTRVVAVATRFRAGDCLEIRMSAMEEIRAVIDIRDALSQVYDMN